MENLPSLGRLPRHTLRIPCQVVRERDFRLVADRVENASLTGLEVSPAEPVLTGEQLIVSFQLPQDGTWVDAEARVARVVHGRRPGETQRCLGLVFEKVDDAAHLALARELLRSPLAPPGRSVHQRSALDLTHALGWFTGQGTNPSSDG